jgi:hypothetical protein
MRRKNYKRKILKEIEEFNLKLLKKWNKIVKENEKKLRYIG